jgi:hypothetical protein
MAFWHWAHSDKCILASHPRSITPVSLPDWCFTAGKQIGVRNCHATCGHWDTAIFTSIVYGVRVGLRWTITTYTWDEINSTDCFVLLDSGSGALWDDAFAQTTGDSNGTQRASLRCEASRGFSCTLPQLKSSRKTRRRICWSSAQSLCLSKCPFQNAIWRWTMSGDREYVRIRLTRFCICNI